MTVRPFVFGLTAAAVVAGASAETVKLKLVPSGATAKVGGYMPLRATLAEAKPESVVKAPTAAGTVRYGVITLGPADKPTAIVLALVDEAGKPSRLFVDSNGNGDLTDDPPTEWEVQTNKTTKGGADVTVKYGPATSKVHLGMYMFDSADPARAALKDVLLYYSDYAYEGDIRLGQKTYKAMMSDMGASGDWRGKTDPKSSGISLLIDVNGNGKIDSRGERFDVRKPFNVGGVTYEIAGLTAAGGTFEIRKSKETVAEVLPPPDLSTGQKAITFTAKTTAGDSVAFPATYKGRLVMLDFWATWCGPCRAELPHLTAAYEKFHSKGFDVLGISLDRENWAENLAKFTTENKMPWPQVYDGKFWSAEIAQLYVVDSIPRAFLVDGDTGKIVASGNDLRGEKLAETIEAALAKKSTK